MPGTRKKSPVKKTSPKRKTMRKSPVKKTSPKRKTMRKSPVKKTSPKRRTTRKKSPVKKTSPDGEVRSSPIREKRRKTMLRSSRRTALARVLS